jgi:hypothetical protein
VAAVTITVNGTVVGADGRALAGGRVELELDRVSKVDDAGTDQAIMGAAVHAIAGNGSVNFEVVPVEELDGRRFYHLRIYGPDLELIRAANVAPDTIVDPVAIGDLPVLGAPRKPITETVQASETVVTKLN